MGLQRKEMVVALALVADELVRVDPANLKELLAAAQELARAHGVYDASDVYSGDEGEVDGVVAWAADSSSDAAMLATADLC